MARLKKKKVRDKIVASATKLFAKQGYFCTSVNQIAKNAEIAVGTIYVYFDSKDEILIDLFLDYFKKLMEEIKNMFEKSNKEPLEKLLDALRYMVNKFSEDIDMAKVFLVELRQSNKALNFIAPKIQKDYEELIKNLLDEAKGDGLLKENIDTQVISISTFGLIETMLFDWLNRGYSKDKLINNLEKTAKYFVNGIKNV